MKYKIIIGSKKQLTQDQADKLINFLHSEGYKEGEINMITVCDGCGVELPKSYPTEPDKDGAVLCPNCDSGKQDAMKGSI